MEKLTLNIPVILPDIPDLKDKCVSRLIDSLEGREGIQKVHVKTNGKEEPLLCIHFNPNEISLQRIKEIAKTTGAQLHDTFGHLAMEVSGIRHSRHARSVTRRLNKLSGVVDAYASASGQVRIEFNRDITSKDNLLGKLDEMGLYSKGDKEVSSSTEKEHDKKEEAHDHDHEHGGVFGEKTELIFSLISGGLLVAGFGLSFVDGIPEWTSIALYIGA